MCNIIALSHFLLIATEFLPAPLKYHKRRSMQAPEPRNYVAYIPVPINNDDDDEEDYDEDYGEDEYYEDDDEEYDDEYYYEDEYEVPIVTLE